jgi:hypothetical protein
MWPFLVFGVQAVKAISSKYKDLFISLATAAGAAWALCAYEVSMPSDEFSYFELFKVEILLVAVMASILHFSMDGLED